jgi:hypothetical protein
MIHEVGAERGREMPLGDCHAHGVGEALAERTSGGLDTWGDEILGMAGRKRAELAKPLDLIDRHLLVAEQMEQRVDQHRAMAGRQHETVAVGPGGIGRIELQEPGEQHGGDVGRAHGQAGMTGFRLLDRVHGQRADGVRHAVVLGARCGCDVVRAGYCLRGRGGGGKEGLWGGHHRAWRVTRARL